MKLHQFQNQNLSHFSYGILEEKTLEVVLIDPSRNMAPYLEWADDNKATITDVIETHPHADFISSHLEISQRTGAKIHVSSKFNAQFPHNSFDDGDRFYMGGLEFRALNTPGHSPDSICIVMTYLNRDYCVFTGDTLFIGDCGRPDLRETSADFQTNREVLARQMFKSLRGPLSHLANEVLVYPAHGAGSLCGKSLSAAKSSTIGAEKKTNWSMGNLTEEQFIDTLLKDQPFTPKYFSYDVELNQKGAPVMEFSLQNIPYLNKNEEGYLLDPNILLIDTRNQEDYNQGHYANSYHIMSGPSFSTWLGSIIKPNEPFYILTDREIELDPILIQTSDIGYDLFNHGTLSIEGLPFDKPCQVVKEVLDMEIFLSHLEHYTIIDVRNPSERAQKLIFSHSISIPLYELRDRLNDIPTDKPIIVHCASGYRSAAGVSIIRNGLKTSKPIFDLGEKVKLILDGPLLPKA